ncbi:uncharacterized protein [Physcomitrium patens]|uniref:uncharacterized protein n=1 Tax=Physcomitrium patens TaxID=3218 RepID=UPI003CCD7BA4
MGNSSTGFLSMTGAGRCDSFSLCSSVAHLERPIISSKVILEGFPPAPNSARPHGDLQMAPAAHSSHTVHNKTSTKSVPIILAFAAVTVTTSGPRAVRSGKRRSRLMNVPWPIFQKLLASFPVSSLLGNKYASLRKNNKLAGAI